MHKYIAILSFLVSLSVEAGTVKEYHCTELLNPNVNGKAYNVPKSVDFLLTVFVDEKDAKIDGSFIASAESEYYDENEEVNLYAYFIENKKVSRKGNKATISSKRSNLLCGSGTSPCREWEKLDFNFKTKVGTLNQYHSYKRLFGKKHYENSIQFKCKKI